MARIYWQSVFSMGVEEIDNQHKKIIDFINQTYDGLEVGMSVEQGKLFFEALVDHAVTHFATEEKYFEMFNYEGKTDHVAQHELIKRQIGEFQRRYGENPNDKLLFEVLSFLDDWLFGHLMEWDKKYVKCFSDHGLK